MDRHNIPADIFFLDPAKQFIVTGQYNSARFPSQYGWMIGATLLACLLSLRNIVFLIQEYRLNSQETATTIGKITRCSSGGPKSATATINYSFMVNEKTLSAEELLASCDQLIIGNEIKITYARNDPDLSHTGEPEFKRPPDSEIIGNSIYILMIVWVAIIFRNGQREKAIKKLLSKRLIYGKLKRSRKAIVGRLGMRKYCLVISYEFNVHKRKRIHAYATGIRKDLKELPAAGRPVAVLYTDAENYSVV